MGTQIDKMELTTGQRGVIQEQKDHYNAVEMEFVEGVKQWGTDPD